MNKRRSLASPLSVDGEIEVVLAAFVWSCIVEAASCLLHHPFKNTCDMPLAIVVATLHASFCFRGSSLSVRSLTPKLADEKQANDKHLSVAVEGHIIT